MVLCNDDTIVDSSLYTEVNGVFIFHGLDNGDAIYGTMTNTNFSTMALQTSPVTINIDTATLDLDYDGVCDKYDALLLLRYANNLHKYDSTWADDLLWQHSQRTGAEIIDYLKILFTETTLFDMDGDGVCDKYDSLLLLRYANNLNKYDTAWADDLLWQHSQRIGATTESYIQSHWQTSTVKSILPAFSFVDNISLKTQNAPVFISHDAPAPAASEAPTNRIFVETENINVAPGDTFVFNVKHELVNAVSCLGFSLEISFDTNYFECTNIGERFRNGSTPVINNTTGIIYIAWIDAQGGGQWLTPTDPAIIDLIKTLEFKVKENAPVDVTPFSKITFTLGGQDRVFEADVPIITVNIGNAPTTPLAPVEFEELHTLYPGLNLSANMDDYNIIVIKADELSAQNLQDAILEAGTMSGNDLIVLRTTNEYNTISLGGTELAININGSITIVSLGDEKLKIDANEGSRVLSIASGTTVALAGLMLTGGVSDEPGGGINSSGNLTLTDCTIENNVSKSYGGGIYSRRGTLTIDNCIITGNATDYTKLAEGVVSGGTGGGIYNIGTMNIANSKITNNTSTLFAGGGIYNEGTMTVTNCEIKENKAHWGGGVTNTNFGTLTMTGCTITENIANQGYGGIGNAGKLTISDSAIIANDAAKLGGGIGNNSGTVTFGNGVFIADNTSNDGLDNVHSYNGGTHSDNYIEERPRSFALSSVNEMPVYEISGPEEIFEKTMTHWEFSAVSSIAIKDWEINWGDGSETTQILGGPRSRVSETHYYQEAGTYSITIKTTDFNDNVNSTIIGTYTVKARVIEPLDVEDTLIAPETDIIEFTSVESSVVSFASQPQEESLTEPFVAWSLPVNESRFTFTESYLSEIAETMRQRQMVDLDGRNSGQADIAAFTDLIWADDELFDHEWMDFSEKTEIADFWSDVFEEELLALR